MDATPLSPALNPQGNPSEAAGPEPFRVHIPTHYLEVTQQKFEDARLPAAEVVEGGNGTNEDQRVRTEMDTLIDHWHETYSWRHEEETLNALPQFRLAVPVAPFGLLHHHFLWHCADNASNDAHDAGASHTTNEGAAASAPSSFSAASTVPSHPLQQQQHRHKQPPRTAGTARPPPILLVGESWEFVRLFRELRRRGDVDVVLPSPPGMGFSNAPALGFGIEHCARGLHALMQRLGYAGGYVVHGSGTLGFAVARMLVLRFPAAVRGLHLCHLPRQLRARWWHRLRLCLGRAVGAGGGTGGGSGGGGTGTAAAAVDAEGTLAAMTARDRTVWEYALTDSPLGLLTWVAGRIRSGATTKHAWTHNEILTAFMYYWTSGPSYFFRMLTTARDRGELDEVYRCSSTTVPIGLFLGQQQQQHQQRLPQWYVQAALGGGRVVVYETRADPVGRWVAWEEPEAVADALTRFWAAVAVAAE